MALSATRYTQVSDFGGELARLMTARGLGVRELARLVPCNPGHISNLRSGKARPSPELARMLDDRLDAGGTLAALAPSPCRTGRSLPCPPGTAWPRRSLRWTWPGWRS
jgi:transcriptional regulator with XRE-family HTH domain